MLGLRSLIGLFLSVLVHAGIAYLVIQAPVQEKPKPKKITLAMDIFREVPAPVKDLIPKPIVHPVPAVKPIVTPPKPVVKSNKAIEKVVRKPKVRIEKKQKKKQVAKKTKAKKIIKKVLKKRVVKAPPVKPPKKKTVIKQRPQQVRRATPSRKRIVTKKVAPVRKQQPTRVVKRVVKVKPSIKRVVAPRSLPKPMGNAQLEKQFGSRIYQLIQQKKSYPRRAKRRKVQGVVRVAFSLGKNGRILNLRIHQSSGSKTLDKAALDAVRRVGKFPLIPSAIHKQMLSYILPIAYRLR